MTRMTRVKVRLQLAQWSQTDLHIFRHSETMRNADPPRSVQELVDELRSDLDSGSFHLSQCVQILTTNGAFSQPPYPLP